MRIRIGVVVRLLPMDQLSRGVRGVIPAPYRSPMILPFQGTTKAAVMAAAGSNAASTARRTPVVSRPDGSGFDVKTPPVGHAWVEGSGSRLLTRSGAKATDCLPTGRVTHPRAA